MASFNVSGPDLRLIGKSCAAKVGLSVTVGAVLLLIGSVLIEHRAAVGAAFEEAYAVAMELGSFGGSFWGSVFTASVGMCCAAWALCTADNMYMTGGKEYELPKRDRALLVAVGAGGSAVWLLGALATKSVVAGIATLTTYQAAGVSAVCLPMAAAALLVVVLAMVIRR